MYQTGDGSKLIARINKDLSNTRPLASTIRISDELYEQLRTIRILLESQYKKASPTMQDIVTVALHRFLNDWEDQDFDPDDLTSLNPILEDLLQHRKIALRNMGRKRIDDS